MVSTASGTRMSNWRQPRREVNGAFEAEMTMASAELKKIGSLKRAEISVQPQVKVCTQLQTRASLTWNQE